VHFRFPLLLHDDPWWLIPTSTIRANVSIIVSSCCHRLPCVVQAHTPVLVQARTAQRAVEAPYIYVQHACARRTHAHMLLGGNGGIEASLY
jgi:hypothetical protein